LILRFEGAALVIGAAFFFWRDGADRALAMA
jgi:hypothetical protein